MLSVPLIAWPQFEAVSRRAGDRGALGNADEGRDAKQRRGLPFSLANPVENPGKPVFGFFVSNIEKSKRACG